MNKLLVVLLVAGLAVAAAQNTTAEGKPEAGPATTAPEASTQAAQGTTEAGPAGAAPTEAKTEAAPKEAKTEAGPATTDAAAAAPEGANEAGNAADQVVRRRRASPSPSPESSPAPGAESSPAPDASPAPGAESSPAPDASPAPEAESSPAPAKEGGNGTASAIKPKTNIADKRISAFYDTPAEAAKAVPELKELSKLIAASPAISKALSDKNLKATIFAPSNDAVKSAIAALNETQPGIDAKTLAEAGVLDGLLQYHVTEGAALTSERLTNNMTLTMLNKEKTTIVVGADGSRRLLQDAPIFIKSNTGQKFGVAASNVQGGASIIHVIDGVLIPKSMAEQFNLTTVPGATAESTAAAEKEANATAAEAPAGAPAAAKPPAPKSSAGTAVATLLALPTLLAVLML